MKNRPADIIAKVNLFSSDAGGRQGPTPPERFSCLMVIDGKNFDVRLHLEDSGPVAPGKTVRVPISFLDREYAREFCSVGKAFVLRETRPIGEGMIEELLFL